MDDLTKIEEFAKSEENSRIRADLWGDYVGWSGRRRGENGILIEQLEKHKSEKILKAALGDGADAIYLINHGFNIQTNEFDSAFREKAIENADKQGINLTPTGLDWRELSSTYDPKSFDAVLCMGNSLTCLKGTDNHLKALKEFFSLLRSGGILIIDERNYQFILDHRNEALAGTLHSSGKQLYTGTDKVRTRFIKVEDGEIVIQYEHVKTGNKAYYTKAYPFKRGELEGLLNEAGFSKIEKFSDYEPGDNPEADFYQYFCIK